MQRKVLISILIILSLVLLYETFISKRIYDVTFIDGDTVIATYEVERGSIIPKQDITITKEGYQFKGWAFNGLLYNDDYIVKSDMIINAIWEKVK